MIPIVGFVGTSNCGKTTVLCRVVGELAARGYRVATIKHSHETIEVDHEGKDTFKHREAGACQVIAVSAKRLAVMSETEAAQELDELVGRFVDDADIVLVEGFKHAPVPKIEVWREGQPDETIVCRDDPHWLALATDYPLDVEVPVLDLNWPEQIADFIEQRFLKDVEIAPVRLLVDGKRIELNAFAAGMLAGVVRGALGSLKGCTAAGRIRLDIDPPRE